MEVPRPAVVNLQQLHPDLLCRVAEQLGSSRSLAHLAAASSRLRRAAVEARSSISVDLTDSAGFSSLCGYLSNHGQHITSISLVSEFERDAEDSELLRVWDLPGCSQLRELRLCNLSVQLGAGAPQHLGVLHSAATALTKLCMCDCVVADGAAGFAAIGTLARLRHLECDYVADVRGNMLSGSALAALQQLTHLHLNGACDQASLLEHLSRLSPGPQVLILCEATGNAPAAAYSGLQHLQQLRTLDLQDWGGSDLDINVSSMPFLAKLSGLQALALPWHSRLDPTMLASFRQLQRLNLAGVRLTYAGMAGLLAQLQQLPGLRHLSLDLEGGTATPVAAYSSLTASSGLKELVLRFEPAGDLWGSIFPAGRQLGALTCIQLCETRLMHGLGPHPIGAAGSCLDGAALRRLAGCCVGVRELWLQWHRSRLGAGATGSWTPDVTPLNALTALSCLVVDSIVGEAACAGLAQLTCPALRKVRVMPPSRVDSRGLLQFTALKHLTHLRIMCRIGVSDPLVCLTTQAGGKPDVAQQLVQQYEHLKVLVDADLSKPEQHI